MCMMKSSSLSVHDAITMMIIIIVRVQYEKLQWDHHDDDHHHDDHHHDDDHEDDHDDDYDHDDVNRTNSFMPILALRSSSAFRKNCIVLLKALPSTS